MIVKREFVCVYSSKETIVNSRFHMCEPTEEVCKNDESCPCFGCCDNCVNKDTPSCDNCILKFPIES